ncbi:MAG: CDGSH iron-sulfur domain-containing protein [Bacteroidota bacterium]
MGTKIVVNNNGSFRLEGEDIEIVDMNGNRYNLNGRTRISLCRCGLSKTKPFCDAAHKSGGFQSVCEAYELPPITPKQ